MLHVAAVRPDSLTAGLSPNGKRTEVFLAGCKMAREGHPCPGCFNEELWSTTGYQSLLPKEVFEDIEAAGNKFVTIVGGEPLDQYFDLIELLELLKAGGYHIVLITHYTIKEVDKGYTRVMPLVDTIIDGPYEADKRIFDDKDVPEGVRHVIGSSNQRIWVKGDQPFVWKEENWRRDPEVLKEAYGVV